MAAKVLIAYGTVEGYTEKIAGFVVRELKSQGFEAERVAGSQITRAFDRGAYAACIVASPIHSSVHHPSIVEFVKQNRDWLESVPSAFLSVSLSAAGVEAQYEDARRCIETFLEETSWKPSRWMAVAGALRYTQYGFFKRFIMRRIAKKAGGDTDTSLDYEYTNWGKLSRFIEEFAAEVVTEKEVPAYA